MMFALLCMFMFLVLMHWKGYKIVSAINVYQHHKSLSATNHWVRVVKQSKTKFVQERHQLQLLMKMHFTTVDWPKQTMIIVPQSSKYCAGWEPKLKKHVKASPKWRLCSLFSPNTMLSRQKSLMCRLFEAICKNGLLLWRNDSWFCITIMHHRIRFY